MRYAKKIMTAIMTSVFALLCFAIPVFAGEVVSTNVEESDGTVVVSGTAESTVLSVVVVVENKSNGEVVSMKSVEVLADGSFKATFTLAEGEYLVKSADYEGGDFKSTTVVVGEEQTDEAENDDPPLGDRNDMTVWIVLAILATVGITGICITKRNATAKV